MRLPFSLVDVFTRVPYRGNSLAVFPDGAGLSSDQMLTITQELRHFESIFLEATGDAQVWKARVFDLVGELGFAGHPVIGAASVLHDLVGPGSASQQWTFVLPAKTVQVVTEPTETGHDVQLDQGPPVFGVQLPEERIPEFASALGVSAADVHPCCRPAVVSTGLRYLVFPLQRGLERAGIAHTDFEGLLASIGAQFIDVIDVENMEGRHWSNDGRMEDVATGSGAGTVAAYLVRHRRFPPGAPFALHQGRFVGRPSEITLMASGTPAEIASVVVGGPVARVATGTLNALPAPHGVAS